MCPLPSDAYIQEASTLASRVAVSILAGEKEMRGKNQEKTVPVALAVCVALPLALASREPVVFEAGPDLA
jgi:hypothetical protein